MRTFDLTCCWSWEVSNCTWKFSTLGNYVRKKSAQILDLKVMIKRLRFASYLWSQSSTTFGFKVSLNSVIKYLHLSIYRSSNLMARKLNVIEIFEFQKRSYFVFEKKGKLRRARCCYKCALEPGRGICPRQPMANWYPSNGHLFKLLRAKKQVL